MNKRIERIFDEIAKEKHYGSATDMLVDYRYIPLSNTIVEPKHHRMELYMLVAKKLLQKRSR